ncbi:hypothetical protein [Streptomyces hirsutus]|uniref:hypothetical protein n=1 Tax=Streptomyces hirsutus TaxID=35620 RepID=UPI00368CE4CA
MKLTTEPDGLEALAEQAVVAACELADAADPTQWSMSAVEDVAAALEVLAGTLARLDPECAEILAVVPAAAAAVLERAEQTRAGAAPQDQTVDGPSAVGISTALRQALAAHGLTRHRVHQLGAALVTVTLDPPEAQALAVLLARGDGVPHQAQHVDDGWGEGPAETATAALAGALRTHGTGAYARVLTSGQVSVGLTPQAARTVAAALTSRSATASRGRRRGLGLGFKGVAAR